MKDWAMRAGHLLCWLLLLLLPLMLLLGRAEGTAERPGLLFWALLLLPLLLLPWLLHRREPEERELDPRRAPPPGPELVVASALASAVAPALEVERTTQEGGLVVLEGRLREQPARALPKLEELLAPWRAVPLLDRSPRGGERVRVLPAAAAAEAAKPSRRWINVLLLAATALTTVWAGAQHQGVSLLAEPERFAVGLPYALALLAILGVHELGHYVAARLHRVDVTWPYFIPIPMGLGTFGAFIQIKSLIKSRRAIFDIGVAGPLAGLVVALPLLYVGLRQSVVLPEEAARGVQTGSSLLLAVIDQVARGGPLGTANLQLSPIAFAGWIGLFVTALNLMPVGQLDGGHIAYALLGRRPARWVGIATLVAMGLLGLTVWPGLLTFAVLIALLGGFSHFPALDDITPPDWRRFAVGVVAFALLVLIVLPVPGGWEGGLGLDCPYM